MEKWSDYVITAIWKDSNSRIIHVRIMKDLGDTFGNASKLSTTDTVKLIQNGATVVTAVWNYSSGNWSRGIKVTVVNSQGTLYLRTIKDGTVTDNLDNLINMNYLSHS